MKTLAYRLAASSIFALLFLCAFHSVASAQIVLDGVMNEPEWHRLGTSSGGPAPSFGSGNEVNALYAKINANHFYIGVAGNIQFGSSILVFIDSTSGGFTNGNFGRSAAPLGTGIANFNQGTVFDDGFTVNYILSIRTESGQSNYFWDLYTLSGSFGSGGGPNLSLGDRNNEDLRANPANNDQTRGFEARLTYSANGSGVDLAISQPRIRMMAMVINDSGVVSNHFISPAPPGQTGNYGPGPIFFNAANTPDPEPFAHMLVVNELDYIQPGANVSEFIEVMNITSIPLSLDTFRLRFARGINSPPEIYREIDLPDVVINPGAFFVICTNASNVPNCNSVVQPPQDLLENAIPAAVAVLQNTLLIDVVSYGGNTGLPYTEGVGVLITDDGTQESVGLSRIMDGVDTNRNHVDFALRCVTPGQPNSAQTSGCGPATPTFTPTATGSVTPTPTGTSTPTGTPTPTGSVTPTSTGSPVPPPPAGCSNILVNGDFESSAGWEFGGSPVPGKYTSIPVHGGIRSVQLGIPPESGRATVHSYSSVRQAVSVPQGATIQLRWWHFHKTELATLDSATNTQDRQEVILLKPNGDTLRIVQRVRRNDSSWQQSVFDLTEYAGHSFVLYFNVLNYGGSLRTWTFIDDVELLVCLPQGAVSSTASGTYGSASAEYYRQQYGVDPSAATSTPTPTPTMTQQQQATVTPSGTPSPTSPSPQLGNTVEQDGYSLTVLAVENPSARIALTEPQAGEKFVAMEIIVRNISGERFSSNAYAATLVDNSGFVYPPAGARVEDVLRTLDVDPGQMVQGWVGFVVPEDSTPAILRYQFFGSGVVLQVRLDGISPTNASARSVGAESAGSTPTATVTPTNTGEPSPTATLTGTPEAFVPQGAPAQVTSQPVTPQQAAPLQPFATPTVVLVAEREIIPENCMELINNGSFEAHGMGWSQEAGKILPAYASPKMDAGAAQSGVALRLGLVGAVNVEGISATQQLVHLPKESNQITLRFRYFPLYEEPPGLGDFQYVDIYHAETGQFAGRALGVQQDGRAWIEREYDLSALAGEPIRLYFMVSNDGVGGNIAMYVDDVSILACRVPKSPQNSLAAVQQTRQSDRTGTDTGAAAANAPQHFTDAMAANTQAEITPVPGFAFGRMGGVLAVLGIAGAALLLLPLARRFTK